MLIRPLAPADAEAYRALRLAGIAELPSAFRTTHAAESAQPLARMQQRLLQTPFQRWFGAFHGDALVGIACFKREPIALVHDRATIWGVYVAPLARGAGVARQLMLAALDHAGTIPGLTRIGLSVERSNGAAAALYMSLGFAFADMGEHDQGEALMQRAVLLPA